MAEIIRFSLRVAPELYVKLKKAAQEDGRSLHGQIIYILAQSLK